MSNSGEHNQSLVNDAVHAMSKLLTRWAAKGKGLEGEDSNGVVVLYNKKQVGLLMFHFVTKDNLSIELEFDLNRLVLEGREYMEMIVEIIVTQLAEARREKQKNESIIVLPKNNDIEPRVSIQDSVRRALAKNPLRTYN